MTGLRLAGFPLSRAGFFLVCFLISAGYLHALELQNITVRQGDTLWSISNVYLKDPARWNELLKYNKLPASDPSLALPGMVLRVPVTLIKDQYRAARLIYYVNRVLLRRSGSADWNGVAAKMELFRSDTLRTTVEARADIKFHTGEILNLYPNSIAVLRPPSKQADVELMSGEMRGVRTRVITISARITPKTKDTEFGARITEDLSTLVQVYKGEAAVESQGKTVDVPAGFASEVRLDGAPSQPVKLPPSPEFEQTGGPGLAGAQTGSRLTIEGGHISLKQGKIGQGPQASAGNLDVKIGAVKPVGLSDGGIKSENLLKMISVASPVQGYHVQAASDQSFSKLIFDKRYDAFDSVNLNDILSPGTYWVRVSCIDLLGFEGKFEPAKMMVVRAGAQR